ncbi:hypothetical protein NQ314_014386 [Rhamnusium bicolor]|uniref:Uncharacterized protein n=1 Tax=Rhamnusium bicolor TaxID=1586634 RepID=A0AAV8X1I8_9CUCU|nr:hypothetical protein NQ314_014386 [Rhamnusium bicolor]
MDGSGLQDLFSTAYALTSTEKILTAHAYSRALRAHSLAQLALATLVFQRIDVTDDEHSAAADMLLAVADIGLQHVKATKDDYHDIIKLKHEAYYKDEPTCYSLGITQNAFMDEYTMSALTEGMTLVAKCKYNGDIVGAAINEATHPWDPDMREKFACNLRCAKVRQLQLFYAYIQRLPDIWNRKKGIALRLLHDSREIAADCGYKVVRCDATSEYT